MKRKDELEYMECGCTEESLLHCLQSAPVLLPLICMLIHQPTIQPSPNKPKTMPLPWTQISQTIVLCVLECKCMNPVAAACTTPRVNIYHTSMQKCAAEVCMGIGAEFCQTILGVAGLLGSEQCWLPSAPKM